MSTESGWKKPSSPLPGRRDFVSLRTFTETKEEEEQRKKEEQRIQAINRQAQKQSTNRKKEINTKKEAGVETENSEQHERSAKTSLPPSRESPTNVREVRVKAIHDQTDVGLDFPGPDTALEQKTSRSQTAKREEIKQQLLELKSKSNSSNSSKFGVMQSRSELNSKENTKSSDGGSHPTEFSPAVAEQTSPGATLSTPPADSPRPLLVPPPRPPASTTQPSLGVLEIQDRIAQIKSPGKDLEVMRDELQDYFDKMGSGFMVQIEESSRAAQVANSVDQFTAKFKMQLWMDRKNPATFYLCRVEEGGTICSIQ